LSSGLPFNPQVTILDGFPREWFPAEVLDFDYEGKDKNTIYTVLCRYAGAVGHNRKDVIRARALDANIKNIPIRGEIILVTKAPSPYASAAAVSQEYYYSNPISIQSSVHHNGLPGLTHWLNDYTTGNPEARDAARDGVTNATTNVAKTPYPIDPIFVERTDVYPIQPYSGDIIFEGRWGQSIRFGSTIDERRKYPQVPTWKKGLGTTGNPILIISNGTNPEKAPRNEFILENFDVDDSSIWLTSGQYVKFEPASTYTTSITDKSINLFTKNEYGGNAVMIASDRIIFNARKQEIIGFSKEGIGFSSEKGISLDGKQVVEIESSQKISLGVNAIEPILLGKRTMSWLNNLVQVLMNITKAITEQTHPTGTGPSGVPINVGVFSNAYANLSELQGKIKELPSQLAFVNEKSGGPSEKEVSESEQAIAPTMFAPTGDSDSNIIDKEGDYMFPHNDPLTLVSEMSDLEKEKVKLLDDILGDEDPKFDYGSSIIPDGDGTAGGPL
jgi:hypothetical protein